MNTDTHLFYSNNEYLNVIYDTMRRTNPTLKKTPLKKLIKRLVQDTSNVYHNIKHTFEVFQMVDVLSEKVPFMTQTDRTILQIAALCHDFHHPGMSNTTVLALGSFSEKSMVYLRNRADHTIVDFSRSYNEMMHVHDSLQLIEKYLIQLFPTHGCKNIQTIITLILSTDLGLHDQYMSKYIQNVNSNLGMMILVLKLADVSHPLRSFHVHLYWVFNHQLENYTNLTDVKDIAKDTLWFYNQFIEPMLYLFDKHFKVPELINQFNKNKREWKLMLSSNIGA